MAKEEFDDTEKETVRRPHGGAQQELLAALAIGPRSYADLKTMTSLGDSTIFGALKALMRDGKVERPAKGLYALTVAGSEDRDAKPAKPRKAKPAPERKRAPRATSAEPEPTEEAPAVEQIELTPDEVRALVLLSRTSLERLSRLPP